MTPLTDEPDADTDGNGIVDPSRRDQIITAADELLSCEGLEGLTIRAVLNRTGLARRAFYESFAGKDDLVLAAFERAIEHAATQFGALLKDIDDPLERIRVIVVRIVLGPFGIGEAEVDRRSTAFSREHLRLAEARPAELARALRPLLALIATQVADGMRAGALHAGDPVLAARLIYNLVATTTHTELLTCEHPLTREGRQALADAIWDFCRRAVTA